MHPFARPRERTRALNAAKLDRIFAKPFVDSLEGHVDAVEVMCRKPDSLSLVASGSWDGGVIVHDLGRRKKVSTVPHAHKGKVSGLCFTGSGEEGRLLTCGVDRTVKLWDMSGADDAEAGPSTGRKPLRIFEGKSALK